MPQFIVKLPSRPCIEAYRNALFMALRVGCPDFVKSELARITYTLNMTKNVSIRNGLLASRVGLKHAHMMMRGKVRPGAIIVYTPKRKKRNA